MRCMYSRPKPPQIPATASRRSVSSCDGTSNKLAVAAVVATAESYVSPPRTARATRSRARADRLERRHQIAQRRVLFQFRRPREATAVARPAFAIVVRLDRAFKEVRHELFLARRHPSRRPVRIFAAGIRL